SPRPPPAPRPTAPSWPGRSTPRPWPRPAPAPPPARRGCSTPWSSSAWARPGSPPGCWPPCPGAWPGPARLPEEQDQGLEGEGVGPVLLGAEQPHVVGRGPPGRLDPAPEEPDHHHFQHQEYPPRQVERQADAEQGPAPEHEPVDEHLEAPRVQGPGPPAIAGRRSAHTRSVGAVDNPRNT